MRCELSGYTDIGTRAENQDSYDYRDLGGERVYAVVADGLGGHEGGQAASRVAVKYMTSALDGETALPAEATLRERLAAANREILERRKNSDQMKSTVVGLYIWGSQAIWTHIGDSRLYHFFNGELYHYTKDHSVPQISVQLGEITRDQIPRHPDRSRLIRVLGGDELRPEFAGPCALSAGQHAFLLCSDGFWEYLHEDEIMLDLNKSATPRQWLDYLRIRRLRRLGAEVDNNTAIALFLEV